MFLTDESIRFCGVNFDEQIPLITAPVGYGKTQYSLRYLPRRIAYESGREVRNALYLTPNKAILEQVIKDSKNHVNKASSWDFIESAFTDGDVRIDVACFQFPSRFVFDGNEITKKYDLLVIDEIDQIVKWSVCFVSTLSLWDWIQSKRKEMIVCGLTATPDLLLGWVNEFSDFRFVDICERLEPKYQTDLVKVYSGLKPKTYLQTMLDGLPGKTLVYCQSAKECFELSRMFERSGFIVSEYNSTVPEDERKSLSELMNEQVFEGCPLRQYVLENERFPSKIDVLFINDSCSCGMNIKDDEVRNIVCASDDLDIIKQVQGRVRHDIDNFVVLFTRYAMNEFQENVWEPFEDFCDNCESKEWLSNHFEINERVRQSLTKNGQSPDFYIDCYRSSNSSIKENPFYAAIVQYKESRYSLLGESQEDYFKELSIFAKGGQVFFGDSDEIRNRKYAANKNSGVDFVSALGLDGEEKKLFTSQEMTAIAKTAKVLKPSGKDYAGKATFIDLANKSGQVIISKKTIRRKTCYEAQKTGG